MNKERNETFWILLVVASFLLGHLLTKSQYLEQQNPGRVIAQNAGNGNQFPAASTLPNPSTNPVAAPAAPIPTPAPADNVPKVTSADHIRGSSDTILTLVEYSDLECPYCKRFHPTMKQILNDYKGKVSWVYRHFPLSFHTNATPAALGSECANEIGGDNKFWEYIDGIFADTNSLSSETINSVADQIDLDKTKFTACLKSKKYQSVLDGDLKGGQEAGVNGTPATFLVNNKTGKAQLISGALPIEQIKKYIDSALNEN